MIGRIARTFAAIFIALVPSVAISVARAQQAHPQAPDSVAAGGTTATINGFDFTLSAENDICVVSWRGNSSGMVRLEMPPPCRFHRGRDGIVRVKKAAGRIHALVESSRPHPELPRDCITLLRGIAVALSDVRVSRHTAKVASCPPAQWDEKVFTGLFD